MYGEGGTLGTTHTHPHIFTTPTNVPNTYTFINPTLLLQDPRPGYGLYAPWRLRPVIPGWNGTPTWTFLSDEYLDDVFGIITEPFNCFGVFTYTAIPPI